MQEKLTSSMLFCHSIFSGGGVDDITDLIVVSDPKQTDGSSNILTLGISGKQGRGTLFKCENLFFLRNETDITNVKIICILS